MSIKFKCPSCQSKIRVPDKHGGKKGICPHCNDKIDIPAATSSEHENKDAALAIQPVPGGSLAELALEVAQHISDTPSENVITDHNEAATHSAPSHTSGTNTLGSAEAKVENASETKPKFIKFNCPGCGKMTGFPRELAGTSANCPACKVTLMVPENSGEESFLLGGVASSASAQARPTQPIRTNAVSRPIRRAGTSPGGTPPPKKNGLLIAVAGCMVVLLTVIALKSGDEKGNESNEEAKVALEQDGRNSSSSSRSNEHVGPQERQRIQSSETSNSPDTENKDQVSHQKASTNSTPSRKESNSNESRNDGLFAGSSQNPIPPVTNPEVSPSTTPNTNESGTASELEMHSRDRQSDEAEEDLAIPKKKTGPEGQTPGALLGLDEPAAGGDNPQPDAGNGMPDPGQNPRSTNIEPVAPPPVCKRCMGTQHVPILPYRPYFHIEGSPSPDPTNSAPWLPCNVCQRDQNKMEIVKAEQNRIMGMMAKHTALEQQLGVRLLRGETRHIAIHAELPPALLKQVLQALDQLTDHLQEKTRSTVLTQTRPDSQETLIFWDDTGYHKYIDMLAAGNSELDMSLLKKAAGSTDKRHRGFFNARRGLTTPPQHMALHQLAQFLMMAATDGNAPEWLTEGFSAYCENVVTQKNLVYSFRYEENQVQFGSDWNKDIRKFAIQGKLKPWEYIFPLNLIGMGSLDYLTCFSMVSFMMKNDPKRFIDLILEIKNGSPSDKALEKVFGRKIKDLQMLWAQWALTQ